MMELSQKEKPKGSKVETLLVVCVGWTESPKGAGVTRPGLLLLLLPDFTQLRPTGNLGAQNSPGGSLGIASAAKYRNHHHLQYLNV